MIYFRQKIRELHEVEFIGPGYHGMNMGPFNAKAGENKYNPDIIMTYGMKYTRQFKKLDECTKLKVHFLCDYVPAIPRSDFPWL